MEKKEITLNIERIDNGFIIYLRTVNEEKSTQKAKKFVAIDRLHLQSEISSIISNYLEEPRNVNNGE